MAHPHACSAHRPLSQPWALPRDHLCLSPRTGRHWWWVPIVSPLLGSIAGVFVYQLMIGCHLESPPPSAEEENVKLAHVKHKE